MCLKDLVRDPQLSGPYTSVLVEWTTKMSRLYDLIVYKNLPHKEEDLRTLWNLLEFLTVRKGVIFTSRGFRTPKANLVRPIYS